jgi:hypothetical protein
MAILEDGLLQLLKQNTDLVTLFTLKGFFLNSVSQSAHDPSMCIQKISATPDTTNDGPSGLNFRRYQFSCYSKSYVTCLQAQELIRIAIDGFHGFLPNGQRVYNIIRDNELDGFDDITGEHRTLTDYFVHFAE